MGKQGKKGESVCLYAIKLQAIRQKINNKKPGIVQCQAIYIVVNRFSGITSTLRGT